MPSAALVLLRSLARAGAGLAMMLLALAGPAAARLISNDVAYGVQARGPAVVWYVAKGLGWTYRMWAGGHEAAIGGLPANARVLLGSDAGGRTVIDWAACHRAHCEITGRVWPNGQTRTLRVALPSGAWEGVQDGRDVLASGSSGVWLRVGRRTRWMRVVNRETLLLQAGSGWAVAEVSINDYVSEIVAFHISPRPQPHLIDYQDETLAGCRCTSAISTFNAPSVDAHYAYWLQDTSSLFSPNPVAPQAATTVCRLDLTTPQPHITWWSPPSNVTTFAITGGRLFAGLGIGDAPTAGVGELAPRWTTTPAPAPALQPTPCPT